MPARQDLGLRRQEHLGVRWLQWRSSSPARCTKGQVKAKPPDYVPNAGFLLFTGDKGEIYFRLFSYARYLNQRSLDETYVDSFGTERTIQLRQDVQLQKFFAPFSGWFLTPKFRYYLYVWSSNSSQGDPAQVVGGGNLSYTFNRFVSVRRRHHLAAVGAQYRRAVSLLARPSTIA